MIHNTQHTYRTARKTILADLQTPVGIYLKVRDLYPESALLESSDFHGGENSFSFIGIDPIARFEVNHGTVTEQYPNGFVNVYPLQKGDDLPHILQQYLTRFQEVDGNTQQHGGSTINGFLGYTSYNAIRYIEPVETMQHPTAGSDIPEMLYILYRYMIVVNHFKNELTIVENLFDNATSQIEAIESLLNNRDYSAYNFATKGEERTNISGETFKEMVTQGIKHCMRGDVFQLVLSRGFMQDFTGDDFKVYRALRSVNPSPYLFYFDFGSFRIFGSSPETHCKITGREASIDPIAGTFKRTGDDAKDRELTEQLLQDPKENAEHVMLVDLARNDLSRHASGVKIDFFKEPQFYSHVIHLVSRVSGTLAEGANPMRVFADTFPAGTLSGAPKVKAMQLISSIEQQDRGAYGGCIGYIGFNGDVNQAITIRSFVSKGGTLYYQAGAGVVSKSVPAMELQEVNNKLGALKKAIDLASTLKN